MLISLGLITWRILFYFSAYSLTHLLAFGIPFFFICSMILTSATPERAFTVLTDDIKWDLDAIDCNNIDEELINDTERLVGNLAAKLDATSRDVIA